MAPTQSKLAAMLGTCRLPTAHSMRSPCLMSSSMSSRIRAVVAEAQRVVRPGGAVLLSTPNENWRFPYYTLMKPLCPDEATIMAEWGHVRRGYTLARLSEMFGAAPEQDRIVHQSSDGTCPRHLVCQSQTTLPPGSPYAGQPHLFSWLRPRQPAQDGHGDGGRLAKVGDLNHRRRFTIWRAPQDCGLSVGRRHRRFPRPHRPRARSVCEGHDRRLAVRLCRSAETGRLRYDHHLCVVFDCGDPSRGTRQQRFCGRHTTSRDAPSGCGRTSATKSVEHGSARRSNAV